MIISRTFRVLKTYSNIVLNHLSIRLVKGWVWWKVWRPKYVLTKSYNKWQKTLRRKFYYLGYCLPSNLKLFSTSNHISSYHFRWKVVLSTFFWYLWFYWSLLATRFFNGMIYVSHTWKFWHLQIESFHKVILRVFIWMDDLVISISSYINENCQRSNYQIATH